jgi:MYXO-CTERM domain-containing protein
VRIALVVCAALLMTGSAAAQSPPVLAIEGPDALAAARLRVERFDRATLAPIVRVVGLASPGPPIRLVLAEDTSAWARQVPSFAAGFAIGEADLVVLFPSRSPVYPHDTLEDVLRHEVAHVLITRAAGGQPVARWFHEGLAVAVERPWDLEDRARLASELLFGPRLSLGAIDALFSADESAQRRAYLLSTAVVRYLMQAYGGDVPARVLNEVARGRSFDLAIAAATARAVPRLEEEFWRSQRTWTTWVPFLASSTILWLGVIGLAALAVRRRRQRSRQIRAGWATEEAVREPGEPTGPASP